MPATALARSIEGGAGETLRRRLLKDYDLHTMLRLPTGAGFVDAPDGEKARFDKKIDAAQQRKAEAAAAAEARAAAQPTNPEQAPAADAPASPGKPARVSKFEAAGLRPDIVAAADRLHNTFGGGREIKKLHEHLLGDETVELIAQGMYEKDQGLVVRTDQRLLFVFHGLTRQRVEDFPLAAISSVKARPGSCSAS